MYHWPKIYFLSSCLFFCIFNAGFSQGTTITGKVLEKEIGEPLPGASITLFHQNDSVIIAGTVADPEGKFELKSIPDGSWVLEISFIGFIPQEIKVITRGEIIDLGTLNLEPSEILLDEVSITGRRSALVTELDKKVYNVEQDVLSESGSVSEILQNIPSVSVDINGNITLRNSGNISFFMNGKPSAMLRRNASAVQEQMPANSIERIEIITNPSAKYRPDGIGGIINIVMKKDTKEGFNGQATANAGTEKRYGGNLTMNYGAGDLKLFGNYGFRHSAGTRLNTEERFYKDPESGSINSKYYESGNSTVDGLSHNLFSGGNYDLNDQNSIEISGSYFTQHSDHKGISEISARDSSNNPDYQFTDTRTNDEFEEELEVNLGYEHVFKNNEDHTLSFETAYSVFDEREDQKYRQAYSFPDNHIEPGSNLVKKSGQQNEILLDYTLPFGEDCEFESGHAGEFVSEDIRYTLDAAGNRFLSNRQVHALYALFGMPVENFSFKAGIRAEKSLIESHLKIPTDSLIPNNYFKIFPTLSGI